MLEIYFIMTNLIQIKLNIFCSSHIIFKGQKVSLSNITFKISFICLRIFREVSPSFPGSVNPVVVIKEVAEVIAVNYPHSEWRYRETSMEQVYCECGIQAFVSIEICWDFKLLMLIGGYFKEHKCWRVTFRIEQLVINLCGSFIVQ